ncbi:MAG: DegT/DnrJ/EryC1/StrS family aminotransferase, partial [Candidatus Udaeobacter sp.]
MSGAPAWHLRTTERVKLLAGAARIVSVSAKPQMKVPFLDLKAHHAPLLEKFNRAIREVIESNAFAGGPFVERFEKEFAAYCRSKYAIGVGNGTDALWLALLALG